MTNRDEDQDWLDALAGKPNPDADPEITRRATLLRQAIQHHEAASTKDFNVEASLQKLKFRMRREGLGGDHKAYFKGGNVFAISNRLVRFALAASIVLTVGLTMRLYLHEQPIQNEGNIIRGSAQQIVLAPDPEARLKQLTTEMDKLGIKYQIERKEGKLILKAAGIDLKKDDIADFLERNHITPPVGMDVELDIRSLAIP